ncbi:hypothetical protein ABZ517_27070 [Streptomyces scabiei]
MPVIVDEVEVEVARDVTLAAVLQPPTRSGDATELFDDDQA